MKRRRRRDRGQAVVEFALILPLFVMLVFAICEFGRVWMNQHVLTTASRTGVRVGILPSSTTGDVQTAVDNHLTAAGLDPNSASISMSNVGTSASSGAVTSVSVSYDVAILTGSLIPALQGTITLNSATTMRHE